jgi:hypothetical protein
MDRFISTMNDTGAFEHSCLPDGYAYASLGPKSLIDRVNVGGLELGVGALVPVSGGEKLAKVRPLRKTDLTTQCDGLLELQLWRCDEQPRPAQERHPFAVADVTAVTHATDYTRLGRLPVAGRRAAAIHMLGAVGKPFNYGIVGVKYGYNRPTLGGVVARDEYFILDSGAYTPTTLVASLPGAPASTLAMVKLFGGLDSHEDYDELELWYNCITADTFDWQMEAYDLCP